MGNYGHSGRASLNPTDGGVSLPIDRTTVIRIKLVSWRLVLSRLTFDGCGADTCEVSSLARSCLMSLPLHPPGLRKLAGPPADIKE